MSLILDSDLRDVHGIDDDTKAQIKAFIQGAIYCWVKNRKGQPFAVRDLVGGENGNWSGTPLRALYQKHIEQGKGADVANDAAGRDIGWLVKSVLADDKRTLKTEKDGRVNSYRWVDAEL